MSTCPQSPAEPPQDEFEPDDDWKAELKERVKSTITTLITDAKNRQLTELRNEVDTLEDRNRVAEKYKQTMEDIRELEKEQYETELEKERNQRRWIAGAPMSPARAQYIVAEQERIFNSIRERANQPNITAIRDPGTFNGREQPSPHRASPRHSPDIYIPEPIPARVHPINTLRKFPSPFSSAATHMGLFDDYQSSIASRYVSSITSHPIASAGDHASSIATEEIKKERNATMQESMVKLQAESLQATQEANLARNEAERLEQELHMIEQQANTKRQEARQKKEEAKTKQVYAMQKADEVKRCEAMIEEERKGQEIREEEEIRAKQAIKRREMERERERAERERMDRERAERERLERERWERDRERERQQQHDLYYTQPPSRGPPYTQSLPPLVAGGARHSEYVGPAMVDGPLPPPPPPSSRPYSAPYQISPTMPMNGHGHPHGHSDDYDEYLGNVGRPESTRPSVPQRQSSFSSSRASDRRIEDGDPRLTYAVYPQASPTSETPAWRHWRSSPTETRHEVKLPPTTLSPPFRQQPPPASTFFDPRDTDRQRRGHKRRPRPQVPAGPQSPSDVEEGMYSDSSYEDEGGDDDDDEDGYYRGEEVDATDEEEDDGEMLISSAVKRRAMLKQRQRVEEIKRAREKEEEIRRKEEEIKKKEEETRRKEEETRRKEEIRAKEAEIKRQEEVTRAKEAEATRKKIEAYKIIEELSRKEEEAAQRAEEARMHEQQAAAKREEARRKEDEARQKETLARRKEDEAKRKEAEILRREQEAKGRAAEAKKLEDDAKRKENDLRRKEEATKKREEKLQVSEQTKQMKLEVEKIAEKAKEEQMRLLQLQEETRKRAEEIQEREKALYLQEREFRGRVEDLRRKEDEAKKLEEAARVKEAEAKHREDVAMLAKSQTAARKLEDARKAHALRREEMRKREEAQASELGAARHRQQEQQQLTEEENRKIKQLIADKRQHEEHQEAARHLHESVSILNEKSYVWQQLHSQDQDETTQRKGREERVRSDSGLAVSSSPGPRIWRPSQSTPAPSPFTTAPSAHTQNSSSSPSGPMPFTRSTSTVPTPPAPIIRSAWTPQPPTPLPKGTPNIPTSGKLRARSASCGKHPSGAAYAGSEERKRLQEQFIKDQQENFQRQQQKLDANQVHNLTTPTRSAVPSQSSNSVLVRSAGVSSASQSALGHGTSRASPVLEHEPYLFARPPSRNIPNIVSPSSGVKPSIWSKSTKHALLADEDQDTIVAGNHKGKEPQRQEDRYSGWEPGVAESLSKEELELTAAHRRQMKSAASRPGKRDTENRLQHEQKRKGPSVTIEVVSDEDMDHHNGDTLSINAPIILENATPKVHHSRH